MIAQGSRLLACLVLLFLIHSFTPPPLLAQPDYAEWGRIAVQETIKRYHADVTDYLHVGRRDISATLAEETFKLWVKQGAREFGVLVVVRFNPETKEQISITFRELG